MYVFMNWIIKYLNSSEKNKNYMLSDIEFISEIMASKTFYLNYLIPTPIIIRISISGLSSFIVPIAKTEPRENQIS